MTMIAQQVQVQRVENGWILSIYHGGNTLSLVAKDIGEVVGFIKGMEWHTPRPLPEMELGGVNPMPTQSLSGASYR